MKSRFSSLLCAGLTALALLGLSLVVHADPLITIVATNGTPAPDGIGMINFFAACDCAQPGAALNDAGQASFGAQLAGSGVTTTNNTGTFRGTRIGTLTQIVRGGQAVPDGTNSFDNVFVVDEVPPLNNAGQVAFRATLAGPGIGTTNDTGIFRGDGTSGSLTEIVREGQLAPDGDGGFDDATSFLSPAFNNSGQVAFYGTLTGTANAVGFFRGDGTTLTQIAREGQIFLGSTFASLNYSAAINNAGQVAFVGMLGNGTNGVFRGDGTTLTRLAYFGQPVPGGSSLGILWSPLAFNDAGQVAFMNLGGGPDEGVFRADGATLTVIAGTGQLTPDGVTTFVHLEPSLDDAPSLNNAGQVAFPAYLAGPGVGDTNYSAIFRGDGISGNLRQIARQGQPAPDSNANFDNLFTAAPRVAMNDSGQVAFLASLTDDGTGLYFYDDHLGLLKVIRTGDPFLGSTIYYLAFSTLPTLGNQVDGLNNCGQVAFYFETSDLATTGIAIWNAGSFRITAIDRLGNDIRLTWVSPCGSTNYVQAAPALTTAGSNNFADISGPIDVSGTVPVTTNYVEINGATNQPARYYRIRRVP
jgi:hypothetical protein